MHLLMLNLQCFDFVSDLLDGCLNVGLNVVVLVVVQPIDGSAVPLGLILVLLAQSRLLVFLELSRN